MTESIRAVSRTWSRKEPLMWFGVMDERDEMAGLLTLMESQPGQVLIQKYDNGQTVVFTRKAQP